MPIPRRWFRAEEQEGAKRALWRWRIGRGVVDVLALCVVALVAEAGQSERSIERLRPRLPFPLPSDDEEIQRGRGPVPFPGYELVSEEGTCTIRDQMARSAAQRTSARLEAIYTPDPDVRRLSATKAATLDRRSGTVKIAFCVDQGGRTTGVRLSKKFLADPQVDRIVKDTVEKWRFRPLLVAGKPTTTCTERSFEICFE